MIKCAVIGAAGLAIGWAVMGVGLIVIAGNVFRQADLDDDEGGFSPRQVRERAQRIVERTYFDLGGWSGACPPGRTRSGGPG